MQKQPFFKRPGMMQLFSIGFLFVALTSLFFLSDLFNPKLWVILFIGVVPGVFCILMIYSVWLNEKQTEPLERQSQTLLQNHYNSIKRDFAKIFSLPRKQDKILVAISLLFTFIASLFDGFNSNLQTREVVGEMLGLWGGATIIVSLITMFSYSVIKFWKKDITAKNIFPKVFLIISTAMLVGSVLS